MWFRNASEVCWLIILFLRILLSNFPLTAESYPIIFWLGFTSLCDWSRFLPGHPSKMSDAKPKLIMVALGEFVRERKET